MNLIKTSLACAVVVAASLGCKVCADGAPYETYLTFDAGVHREKDMTLDNPQRTRISYDRGLRLDVRTGFYVNDYTALELDFGLLHNRAKGVTDLALTPDLENMDHYQYTMMMNAIGKLPVYGPLSLRGGVGFGIAYSAFWGREGYDAFDAAVAFQAISGIYYSIGEDYDIGITSKFLATSGHDLGSRGQASGTRSYALMGTFSFRF
jgi:hypothetical protein